MLAADLLPQPTDPRASYCPAGGYSTSIQCAWARLTARHASQWHPIMRAAATGKVLPNPDPPAKCMACPLWPEFLPQSTQSTGLCETVEINGDHSLARPAGTSCSSARVRGSKHKGLPHRPYTVTTSAVSIATWRRFEPAPGTMCFHLERPFACPSFRHPDTGKGEIARTPHSLQAFPERALASRRLIRSGRRSASIRSPCASPGH